MSYDMDANQVEVAAALIMLTLISMKREKMSKLRCSMFGERAAEGVGRIDVQLREVALDVESVHTCRSGCSPDAV